MQGKPSLFSTQFTNAGKLALRQIAYVISPSSMKVPDLKKCLDTFNFSMTFQRKISPESRFPP
jgi:hypothetical protein